MEIVLILLVAAVLIATLRGVGKYKFRSSPIKKDELPTVSLLIPARNETHTVTRSLITALGIDYPKLEIIVLDDESQDNTSEKIRSFAQDGIRFIAGEPLPEGWIGKNWACHQLAEAASGEYLIFCDMDVHLSSKSITKLIRRMQADNLAGCSVMPKLILQQRIASALIPILPWLTLLIVRLPSISPAYGGLLLFRNDDYRRTGGFKAFAGSLLPEFQIAHLLSKRQKFCFFLDSTDLNISLYKKVSSLNDARERYLSNLYSTSLIMGSLHLLLCVLPILLLLFNWWAYAVLVLAYAVAARLYTNYWLWSALLLPVVCLAEFIMLLVSVFSRMRGYNVWKNRKV